MLKFKKNIFYYWSGKIIGIGLRKKGVTERYGVLRERESISCGSQVPHILVYESMS